MFQNDSHLPCDANWVCAWYSHERKAVIPDRWRRWELEKKRGTFSFPSHKWMAEGTIKATPAPLTAPPPQRHKVMRGNTIFISCHLLRITTMPPWGRYWSCCNIREEKEELWEDVGLEQCLAYISLTAEGCHCRGFFPHQNKSQGANLLYFKSKIKQTQTLIS